MSVDGSIDVSGFPYDIQKPWDKDVVHEKKKWLKAKHVPTALGYKTLR